MVEEKGKQAEERQDEPRLWRPWRPPRRRRGWRVLWAVGMVVAVLIATGLLIDLRPEIGEGLLGLLEGRGMPPPLLTLVALGFSVTAIIVLLAIRMGWRVLWAVGMVVALLTTALLIVHLHPEIWKGLLEERNLTLIAIGVSVTAIIVLLAIGGAASSWTGFRGKTVWDLLQLLIVPLALVVIGFVFSLQQDQRQQAIEDQRAQDNALQAYLDQMSTLLLEKNLRTSEEDSEVRTLARARTLTVLGRLDTSRKTVVMQFLEEARLVGAEAGREPVIALADASLSGTSLSFANLRNALLSDVNLSDADLRGADLRGAYLINADLSGANLTFAQLSGAFLTFANLRNAEGITNEELEQQAASLEGATMPNGQKYEDWLKSKGRAEDGKSDGSS
jgi:uncharacterized protein YjbI with pentapeptide repeats